MVVYRQGDVILKRISRLSRKAKPLPHRILAKGEVTGHCHQITEGTATLFEDEGTLFLRVESEAATLTHEEHHPLTLPHGNFQVVIEREYTPEGWRNVSD